MAFRGINKEKLQVIETLPTPCYIVDEKRLRENGEVLCHLRERTGVKVLLAQKAFSVFGTYPILREYIDGTEASGLYEARLGAEEMPQTECHVFCGAYREDEFEELLQYADHIVFNSPYQLRLFGKRAKEAGKEVGLRINPECSTQAGCELYDPCSPKSRLGTTRMQWDLEMDEEIVSLLDGIHFHTLCEQNADALAKTLESVEEKFKDVLPRVKWVNFGGGHHITRDDYQIELLCECICHIRDRYQVQVYLEPGEAIALNAGYLSTQVLDLVKNGENALAILDMSAACHTPDVIEMPYRPPLHESGQAKEFAYTYGLGGPTCLAGDVVGEYSFSKPLERGEHLLFGDMAIYSMCKNNTFNGMKLPSIYLLKEDNSVELLAEFGYEDFKMRLGNQ